MVATLGAAVAAPAPHELRSGMLCDVREQCHVTSLSDVNGCAPEERL